MSASQAVCKAVSVWLEGYSILLSPDSNAHNQGCLSGEMSCTWGW